MGFLGRLIAGAKRFLGKVKGGLGFGLRLFDKVKSGYGSIKQKIASLPVIGTAASELVNRGEGALSDFVKDKTGIDTAMVGRGLNMARTVERLLPG